MTNDTIPISLHLLHPECDHILKYLSSDQLKELESRLLSISEEEYKLMKYGWGEGDDKQ